MERHVDMRKTCAIVEIDRLTRGKCKSMYGYLYLVFVGGISW